MKRTLCLVLAVVMAVCIFTGCTDKTDKGPIIPVYICDETIIFDPAYAYTDDASVKILSLLYEGLTRVNEKGKVENALMDSYKYYQQEDGSYVMEATLAESYWSDGLSVSANDIVYSIKRIMDPEFSSEAAPLLYELRNARDVKKGDLSIDDLGVRSAENQVVQFIFDRDIDVDEWLETLASPALVPLRESAVSTLTPCERIYETTTNGSGTEIKVIKQYDIPEYAWSTNNQIFVGNGEFTIKSFKRASAEENGELTLIRNSYYHRDPMGNEALSSQVKPNQVKIVFPSKMAKAEYELKDGEQEVALDQLVSYASMSASDKTQAITFDSNISLVNAGKSKEANMLTQHAYYFNTDNELFADADVRLALSMAIDRNHIAELVSGVTASKGWVADGVYSDSSRKKTYREANSETLVSASADLEGAKSLLKGKKKGSFTITCRDSAVEKTIAEYVKSVWSELGYTVKVSALGLDNKGIGDETEFTNYYSLWRDNFTSAYIARDFDVIAIDYTSMGTYAFASLAPFATGFTGKAISLKDLTLDPDYDANIPHITGWQNDEFDSLIEKAFEEKDLGARSTILADAEKILMNEMPVMPLVQYKNCYVKSKDLSGLSVSYYGAVNFRDAKLKNADDYTATEPTEEE